MLPASECGWEISGLACADGSGALGYIRVDIVNDSEPITGTGTIENSISKTGTGTGTDGADCYTKVTGAQLDKPLYFDGIVHSVAFSIIQDGIEYAIKITKAKVVCNPLAFDKCSPCACVTCLPEELCVNLATTKGVGFGTATWDCETRSWKMGPITIGGSTTGTGTSSGTTTGTGSGDGDTYNFDLSLARVEDNIGCAIILKTTGSGVDDNRVITIEDPAVYDRETTGVTCVEGNSTLSRGDGNLAVHHCYTIVNETFQIFKTVPDSSGTGTHQESVGTLHISDRSCEQDCNPTCKKPPEPCCGADFPAGKSLVVSDGHTSVVLLYDTFTGTWGAGGPVMCNIPDFGLSYSLRCTQDTHQWILVLAPVALPRAYTFIMETISCDPFELSSGHAGTGTGNNCAITVTL